MSRASVNVSPQPFLKFRRSSLSPRDGGSRSNGDGIVRWMHGGLAAELHHDQCSYSDSSLKTFVLLPATCLTSAIHLEADVMTSRSLPAPFDNSRFHNPLLVDTLAHGTVERDKRSRSFIVSLFSRAVPTTDGMLSARFVIAEFMAASYELRIGGWRSASGNAERS
ncbi:hypothetical protein SCHPADRAFT_941831 [Schizopora paradoxa]|uniref:Uncharacterized protein n=1 Tax=Schizopora paradoxa TaxID=27342 RepID=A0A0H2S3Z4_9AGAM|nr:hypothetical protein SCHPADRAFT_941831 [Schizopora paradoxa]